MPITRLDLLHAGFRQGVYPNLWQHVTCYGKAIFGNDPSIPLYIVNACGKKRLRFFSYMPLGGHRTYISPTFPNSMTLDEIEAWFAMTYDHLSVENV